MVTVTFQTESNNADFQKLMDLARRFKLPFKIADESVKTKADVLADIEAAMQEVRHNDRTGEKGQSLAAFLDEVEQELNLEKNVQYAD
jgi:hypothetical protein